MPRPPSTCCIAPFLSFLPHYPIYVASRFLFSRFHSVSSSPRTPRVAVVGAGPAGLYAVGALLQRHPTLRVDVLERHPVPFGLVRFGVAPDHPEVKRVDKVFERWMGDERVRFGGNVAVGQDVGVPTLRHVYDAVVLACGAPRDRLLGVKGEDLQGVYAARSFVGWYNGDPTHASCSFDLSHEDAVVIGHGNVAVDVARMLLVHVDALRKTDIASYALEALSRSRVRRVHIVGRRGPVQAAFTPKELRELLAMPECRTLVQSRDMVLSSVDKAELADIRGRKRIVELLQRIQDDTDVPEGSSPESIDRICALRFRRSPIEILGEQGCVCGVRFQVNRLEGEAGRQRAVGTGEQEELPCGAVFRSIGSKGYPPEHVPFHEERGIVPHALGRVLGPNDQVERGLYVTGWLKRGAHGIIAMNKPDSEETINSLLEDLRLGHIGRERYDTDGMEVVQTCMLAQGKQVVDTGGWRRIDDEEKRTGEMKGKPREKLTQVEDMLAIARGDLGSMP